MNRTHRKILIGASFISIAAVFFVDPVTNRLIGATPEARIEGPIEASTLTLIQADVERGATKVLPAAAAQGVLESPAAPPIALRDSLLRPDVTTPFAILPGLTPTPDLSPSASLAASELPVGGPAVIILAPMFVHPPKMTDIPEEKLYTPDAFMNILFRRYFTEFDYALLNRFTIPLYGSESREKRAMEIYRLEKLNALKQEAKEFGERGIDLEAPHPAAAAKTRN